MAYIAVKCHFFRPKYAISNVQNPAFSLLLASFFMFFASIFDFTIFTLSLLTL